MELQKDKVAVITGAASGIGLATATLLAERGLKVVLADINDAPLQEAVTRLKDQGRDALGVQTDVGDFASVQALAKAAYDAFGAVHVVHLNAGISSGSQFFDDEIASWKRIVDINLLGVVWGIKAFAARMAEGGEEGVILATSSGAGAEGTSYYASAYAATKMAVVSLMESLHGQLRDRKSKVKAGVVFPPLTATRLAGDDPNALKGVETYLQSNGVPATLVQPEQVAAMVVDGIERDRFFIRAGARESEAFYGGAISPAFHDWNQKIVRGRSEAQLIDGKPDAYLW